MRYRSRLWTMRRSIPFFPLIPLVPIGLLVAQAVGIVTLFRKVRMLEGQMR